VQLEEPAPVPNDPLEGTPYRVLQRLGAGGMGEVYEAEHTALGKKVVIKLLHRYWSDDPVLVDRLRLEAQVLARLDHQNLVQVVDFGQTAAGRPYFVMERLVGRTLRQELKARGALPMLEAVELSRQMLLGLDAAHAHGIVHRDVKLENVFVCDPPPGIAGHGERTVKVLDFGIAKVIQGAQSDRAPRPLIRPTEVGMSIGTPRFFSPEQARGEAVDARTDIYSAGAVLYCLLTGHGPFDHHRGLAAICRAHVSETPRSPSAWRVEVPQQLDDVVLRALAKRADERFPTVRAFADALSEVAERIRNPPLAPPPSPAPSRPMPGRSDTMWLAPGSPLAAPIVPSEPTESAQRTSPWVAGAAATATATAAVTRVDAAPARRRPPVDLAAAALILSSAALSAVLTAIVLLQMLR
jgi:serine/threonine-protein kinase